MANTPPMMITNDSGSSRSRRAPSWRLGVVAATPEPFVMQTAPNDFYVAYVINAYSKEPDLPRAYSALHQNIQDAFIAAGIEIMSLRFRVGE